MDLVIRQHELEKLVDVAHGSIPETLVVTGSFGSGRSTLLRKAAESSNTASWIIRGTCAESDWMYSGLSAFLSALDSTHGTSFGSRMAEFITCDSPFQMADGLESSISAVSLEPLALFIDDADLLDQHSQYVIGFLLRRRSAKNLRTIISVGELSVDSPFDSFPKLNLPELSRASLMGLGRSITSPLAADNALEVVARSSGGNPMSFKSMLHALSADELYGHMPIRFPIQLGDKLATQMDREISRFSEVECSSLRVLSCAGCVPAEVFEKIAGTHSPAIDRLIRSGHVDRSHDELFITDPRLRAAMFHSMPEAERLQLHSEIADLCTGRFGAHQQWHLSFIDPGRSDVSGLMSEAITVVRNGLIMQGVELAERALTLARYNVSATELEQLTEALLLQCEFAFARKFLRTVQGKSCCGIARPSLQRLKTLLDFVQFATIEDNHIDAIIDAHALESSEACANLLVTVGFCQLQLWDIDKARDTSRHMMQLIGADSPSHQALTMAIDLFAAAVEGREFLSAEAQCRARRLISEAYTPEVSELLVAKVLSLADRHDDARTMLANLLDRSNHLEPIWAKFAREAALTNEYRAGNFYGVRRFYELIAAADHDVGDSTSTGEITRAMVSLLDGHTDKARAALKRARRLTAHGAPRTIECFLSVTRARLAMQEDDFAAANRHFSRAFYISRRLGGPHVFRFVDDYIESLVYAGDCERAEAVLQQFAYACEKAPTAWAKAAVARSRALVLSGEESLREFSQLVESWKEPDQEYLRARTHFAYAMRLKQLDRDVESRRVRAIGQEIFAEIGIDTVNAVCATHDSSSSSMLSNLNEKELSVVRLLIKRHKNSTIAQKLFVSVRTVELRLTTIYRKTGVKSRFELIELLEDEIDVE